MIQIFTDALVKSNLIFRCFLNIVDEGLEEENHFFFFSCMAKLQLEEEEEGIFYKDGLFSLVKRGFSAVKHSVERSKYIEPSFDSARLSSTESGCVGVPFAVGSCGGRESDARGSFPCN